MPSKEDDYTRYRSGVIPYTLEEKQGRKTDGKDIVSTSVMSVGTTATSLAGIGRRSLIRVKNMDPANNIAILTASGTTYSGGYQVGPGAEWEDETDADLWVASEIGVIDISVYERSRR